MTFTPPHDSKKERELLELKAFVVEILMKRDDSGMPKILEFVKRTIHQYKTSSLDVSCVIVEAYMRIHEKITQGEVNNIVNLQGYFKSVCINIIRENYQEGIRLSKLTKKATSDYQATWRNNSYDDLINKEVVAKIIEVFSYLAEIDREIMILRVLEGLSWKEISDKLKERGDMYGISLSDQSLRKRGNRIIKEMRDNEAVLDLVKSLSSLHREVAK